MKRLLGLLLVMGMVDVLLQIMAGSQNPDMTSCLKNLVISEVRPRGCVSLFAAPVSGQRATATLHTLTDFYHRRSDASTPHCRQA